MKNNFKVSIPLAIIITLIAVIYQRSTGPTYPKKFQLGVQDQITIKFPRSHGGTTNAPLEIPLVSKDMTAKVFYKRYPTNDEWTILNFSQNENTLVADLPNQPPAGKLIYYIEVQFPDRVQSLGSKDDPIYIRYKGEVPTVILAPHITFMFLSMLLSVIALIEAIFHTHIFVVIGRITLGCLFFGGMILGPIVQKFAFGVYWAGFPFDWDLTDNKLLIAVLGWLIAALLTINTKRRWPIMGAAVILFAVYSIPHSMQGSEYDYTKGKVITDRD